MIFEGTNKIVMGDVLLVPGGGYNFLGRDLQVQLGIRVCRKDIFEMFL